LASLTKTLTIALAGALAIGLSGLGVNAAFGKDITLVVDGQSAPVTLVYGSVSELLATNNVTLDVRDRVVPELSTLVTQGMVVNVSHARPVQLTLNGQAGVFWTYATTVGQAIADLGLSETSIRVTTALQTPIPLSGYAFGIDTGHDVSVTVAGSPLDIHAFGTVADALRSAGVTFAAGDLITPGPGEYLRDGMAIVFVKVVTQTVIRDVEIPYTVQNSNDAGIAKGTVNVVTPGRVGMASQTVVQTLHDGQVVSETVTAESTWREPVTQVQVTGTKVIPPAAVVPAGEAQEIAHGMVLARGWGEGEFACLVNLWNRESGWRVNASNAYSGAYGIPQALPGSKMASAGADWQTNPATQITWGLGYIAGRYGTPCGAWGHFTSTGWY
jgi:uncharacterized protein YabE (DUF348 family)